MNRTQSAAVRSVAYRAGAVLAIGLLLAACTAVPQRATPDQPLVSSEAPVSPPPPQWRYLRFDWNWPNDESQVDSFLDLLIADAVLRDELVRHRSEITLWRFHRRWSRDAAGHRFTLLLYAPPTVAESIATSVRQNPIYRRLDRDGHLREFRVVGLPAERVGLRSATSDTSWSPDVQQEWPEFIMGASQMWLGLVAAEAQRHANLDLYQRYRATEEAIATLWYEEGNHAFFHHLSGLFGYQPLRVIRRDVMTF